MINLTKAREISIEVIASLEPAYRARARGWLDKMYEDGNPVLITEGFRSIQRSNYLLSKGILAAPGGKSFHNYGLAFDWVPLVPAKKALQMYEAAEDIEENYRRGVEVGAQFRMVPIKSETGHMQDARYADWIEAKNSTENRSS